MQDVPEAAMIWYMGKRAGIAGHYLTGRLLQGTLTKTRTLDTMLAQMPAEIRGPLLDNPERWGVMHSQPYKWITHHVEGWTVMSCRDPYEDARPGSHATFCMQGIHTGKQVEQTARAKFPAVWDRLDRCAAAEHGPR